MGEKYSGAEQYFCVYQWMKKNGEDGIGGCCNLLNESGVVENCPYSLKDIYSSIDIENKKVEFRIRNKDECDSFKIGVNTKLGMMEILCSDIRCLKNYDFE